MVVIIIIIIIILGMYKSIISVEFYGVVLCIKLSRVQRYEKCINRLGNKYYNTASQARFPLLGCCCCRVKVQKKCLENEFNTYNYREVQTLAVASMWKGWTSAWGGITCRKWTRQMGEMVGIARKCTYCRHQSKTK